MCSKMRGPAIFPSFVTCPMMKTAIPSSLASRTKSAVQSRICAGLPIADALSSMYIV